MITNLKFFYDDYNYLPNINFPNKNSCANKFKNLINCLIINDNYLKCDEKYKLFISCLKNNNSK